MPPKRATKKIEEPKKAPDAGQVRRRKKVYGLESSVKKLWKDVSSEQYSLAKDASETFANLAKEFTLWLTKDAVCIAHAESRKSVFDHHVIKALALVFNKSPKFAKDCGKEAEKTAKQKEDGKANADLGLFISIPRIEKIVRANIPAGSRVKNSTPAAMACAVECILRSLMEECISVINPKEKKAETKRKLSNKHVYRAVRNHEAFCHLSGKLGFLGMGAIPKELEKGTARDSPDRAARKKMNRLNNAHFVIQVAGVRRFIKECIGDQYSVSPAASAVIQAAAEHHLGTILAGSLEVMKSGPKEQKTVYSRHIEAAMRIIESSFCLSEMKKVSVRKGERHVLNDEAARRLALRAGIKRVSSEAIDLIRSIFSDFVHRLCQASLTFKGDKKTLKYAMAVNGAYGLGIKSVLGEQAARKLKFKNPKNETLH